MKPEIVSAVVTAIDKNLIPPSELFQAAQNGIAIIAKENIDNLMNKTLSNKVATKEIVDYVRSCIPPISTESEQNKTK